MVAAFTEVGVYVGSMIVIRNVGGGQRISLI